MWQGPGQDPGGGGSSESGPPPKSSQDLSDLQDQFEQQQVLIAQLKEMIRKSEQSSVTQENVDEYMNTLSRRSAKAKKGKKDDDKSKKSIDIPASQKITLLRQQVEENKMKFAERGKSQKGIEEMVSQLKAQLDDSQNLISQTSFNSLSLTSHEIKTEYSENSSSQELYSILLTKEKKISDLLAKAHKLESNVLDLQENLKEKDSVIDARTKAITLMTESLSRKGKNTLDALDDTKEQMRKMQENFVSLESEMKARQMKLLDDLKSKNYEIAELQEVNSNLEKEKLELVQENLQLHESLADNKEMKALREKVQELEELNNELQQKEPSAQTSGGKRSKKKSPTKETSKLLELQQKIEEFTAENERLLSVVSDYENTIKDLNEKLVSTEVGSENEELIKLKKQVDESNKNMIKVKAQHKSKVKELTKKVDAFKKISDANSEIVRLESENCKLSQKVAELEEEKGSLQLKLVESDSPKGSETAEHTEKEFEEKTQAYVRELDEKDKIISILESEITSFKTEIEGLSEKLTSLSHLENVQVTTEMTSIQLEERMDSLESEKKKLITENDNVMREKDELIEKIASLTREKQEISSKLDNYIQENIELVDKLEKLSAEKVSSAESIEIVEGLTQQEKLELEAYQKTVGMIPEEISPQNVDLNESVNELTEETSELLQKIELFTVERREVMDKMEQLKHENNNLLLKIKEIENNRDVLEETYEQLQNDKDSLDAKLEAVEKENEGLRAKLDDQAREEIIVTLTQELGDKKIEIENLSSLIDDLQNKLQERDQQNSEFSNTLTELKTILSELESENNLLQERVKELEEYKVSFNEIINRNREELESVSNADWENRRLIENKDNEIAKLIKERDNTHNVIEDLQKAIREKDENFQKISSTLKDKYLTLQKQLEDNSGSLENIQRPLEIKIEELTAKNKEQLEKMKKIAANLKKKTQAYLELEEKHKQHEEKWVNEIQEKDLKIIEQDNKITSLVQQLHNLETEVSKLHQDLREKSDQNVELQNLLTDLRVKIDKANEISLQQELLQTQSDFVSQQVTSNEDALNSKIQELEMIVETQEGDLVKYRQRVSKLEEEISTVQETRVSLEERANELGIQLQEKSMACDEISMSEDVLEQRFSALAAHDEAVEKKLKESVEENQELSQQIKKVTEKNEKLKKKLLQTLEKVKGHESNQYLVVDLENQNGDLKKQVQHLENELRVLQNDYQRILDDNKNEFDKVNSDWQVRCDELVKDKNELLVKYEELENNNKELIDKNTELNELKTKLREIQHSLAMKEEEIDNLRKSAEESQQSSTSAANNLSSFFDPPNVDQPHVNSQQQQLEDELNICRQQINQLNVQIDELKSDHYNSIKKLEEMEFDRNRLESELEDAKLQNNEQNLRKTAEQSSTSAAVVRNNNLSSFFDPPSVVAEPQNASVFSTFFDQPLVPTLEVQEIQSEKPHMEDELNICRQQINQLTVQVDDLKSSHYNSIKRLEEMEFDRNRLETELEDAKSQNTELMLNIDEQNNSSFFDHSQRQQQLEELEFERERVEEQLKKANNDLQSAVEEIQDLKLRVQELEVKKVAEGTVDSVIFEAESKVDDPFSFVANNQQRIVEQVTQLQQQHSENSQEELLNKIKTLEFMLYSVDKEKDDAVLQCDELTNELTRLIYERENQVKLESVDSQILSDIQINQADLQKIEFEDTKDSPESVIVAKNAYLCYNPDDDIKNQIVQPQDTVITAHVQQQMQDIEFEPVREPLQSSQQVVDEADGCKAKNAYICSEAGGSSGKDTFGENDDGWGWSPDEAKLEEEHASKLERENVRVLEIERENHLEEIKQLQIKSGKLIKKLKEFKQKNEQLTRDSKNDFFDLNDTIQEELKLQIQQIEKKLKETREELDKEKKEKATTLKRIDVLTAANERMLEMKEKQDVEMLGWQRNCKELGAKLERFEWGADSEESQPTETVSDNKEDSGQLHRQIQELNDTIKDLTLDNEELQSLLEHQRELRMAAEKARSVEPIAENMKSEAEYLAVVQERDNLHEEKKTWQDAVNELIRNNSELTNKFRNIEIEKEKLTNLICTKDEAIQHLNETIETLQFKQNTHQESLAKEKDILFQELQDKNVQIDSLRESLEQQISLLKNELDIQTTSARSLLEQLNNKDIEFSLKIEHLNSEWQLQVDQRGSDVAESWKLHLESRESEFSQIEGSLRKEINELEEKSNALVNENNELRKNVDAEIRNEVDRVSSLQQQINERQQYINELTKQLQEKHVEVEMIKQELSVVKEELQEEKLIVDEIFKVLQQNSGENILREKNNILNVFNSLINKIDAKESEISQLKEHIDHLNSDLSKAVMKSDEFEIQLKHLNENHYALQSTIEEKNQVIENLNHQLQENCETENVDNLQQINQQLNTQVEEGKLEIANLIVTLEGKQREYDELQQINQQVEESKHYQLEVDNLKVKLEESEYSLESLTQESNLALSEQSNEIENLKRRMVQTENRYEELLVDKDSNIESLKLQLTEADRGQEIGKLFAQIDEKIEEINNLQMKINEQNVAFEEESKQQTELRSIIQEQVLKIEDLKKELFNKSNDFDSLIAEMDISRTSQQSADDKEKSSESASAVVARTRYEDVEDDLTEPVSRAELDLALYMLHQRDVRCEELTMELTQLLEERDTLQLRLSNAIREKEDISRHLGPESGYPSSSSTGTVPKHQLSAELGHDATQQIQDAQLNPLETKLSQLKSVGYKRDKTIVDEQELRRFQQLNILQQHRDVASKLPPEAAARLVDASYTLSRDVQSPSKVLLNWLWGRSTPRVNNI